MIFHRCEQSGFAQLSREGGSRLRLRSAGQFEDLPAVVVQGIEGSVASLAETDDVDGRVGELLAPDHLLPIVVVPQPPHLPVRVIPVEVGAFQLGKLVSLVEVAAGDGPALAVVMFHDGRDDGRGSGFRIGVEGVRALHHGPAVIAAPADQLDELPEILPHVPDPGLSGDRIEAEPPRVAKAVGPDLFTGPGHADEGIVLGNGIGPARVRPLHVEPHHDRQQVVDVLAGVLPVGGTGAVPGGDVEVAVRTDDGFAAVVTPRRPLDDDLLRLGIQPRWIAARLQFEPGDPAELLDRVARFILLVFQLGVGGAEDEHLTVLAVPRMEGKGRNPAVPVQDEVFPGIGIVPVEAVDPAQVLGDQQALGVRVLSDEDGIFEGVLGEDTPEPISWRGFG